MFDELSKYKQNDHFFFKPNDNLEQACNAPVNKGGLYIIYALKNGRIELVYIGYSGEVKPDNIALIGKEGLGGLQDQIVKGEQFGSPRHKILKAALMIEKMEAVDIYWYVTHTEKFVDNPKVVAKKLLKIHSEIYGRLPKWNDPL